ncbi:MAG: hypothetical protein EZS28_044793 [Streblomastix strix]|uniref:Uncharacterized protein n=1 Tax=Streblomastix strix TaxID=222440 RepID=A0A5J4TP80_9EUKA|nr:MAG: hypothetical protein EZS28_044793 [Streblomastix strix]
MQDQIGESSVEHVDKKPKLTEELNEETADVQPLSTCNQVIKIIVQLSQAKLGNEITDDSKCQTAKQIIPLLWKLKEDEIIKTFDLPLCIELSSQFSRCRTKTELKLLETVEYIAKNAAENENELERQKFADIFAESGLYKMVKDSIRVRISYQDYDQSDEDEDFEQWIFQ